MSALQALLEKQAPVTRQSSQSSHRRWQGRRFPGSGRDGKYSERNAKNISYNYNSMRLHSRSSSSGSWKAEQTSTSDGRLRHRRGENHLRSGDVDCFGTRCECSRGQGGVYPARQASDHTLRLSALKRKSSRWSLDPHGKSLLGSVGQICGGFYHTSPSVEAGNPKLCLGEDVCRKAPTCVLLARVDDLFRDENGVETWSKPVYEARYTNCYRGYSSSVHAENFMMHDPALHAILTDLTTPREPYTRRLTMFITQQPCHHSSGRVENKHVTAKTSCTRRLLDWRERVLKVYKIRLDIKLSRIFRAHWTDESVHENAEELEVFGSRLVPKFLMGQN